MFQSLFRAGACAAAMIIATVQAGSAADVGITSFTFEAKHRQMPVQSLVWYPSEAGRMRIMIGDDAVFVGTEVRRDARPEPGKHPVVLLSHGSGGNGANLGWIAARLVAEGFIVVAPNHPGSTSGDSRPETNVLAWQRPMDMTALLDAFSQSKGWAAVADFENVTVMGFSMGGHTALAMGGARIHAKDLAAYCDRLKDAPDCVWYERGNDFVKGHIDLHSLDATVFDADYTDPRVKRVIAIDPAPAQAFDAESLAAMRLPVLLVNLGQGDAVPEGVRADKIAELIPSAQRVEIKGADHFSFLAECKMFGWVALYFDGDDPICTDASSRSRNDIHEEIAEKIIGFLKN